MSYKSIEVTGKSEEEAIGKALAELGLERDDVSVEILERAKSGFLGLKTTPAKIRVTYEVLDEIKSEEPVAQEKPVYEEVDYDKQDSSSYDSYDDDTEYGDERAKKAEEFLTGLFEKMDVNAVPDVRENEHGISIELKGEKLGAVIGRRGETLDAIQHLTNYTVNRGRESRVRVTIDAENYRKKREESLASLAERMAGKAVKYKRNFTLEPMNSYERHVIHSALQGLDNITTRSTGSEPNRRVVIVYDGSQQSGADSFASSREWK